MQTYLTHQQANQLVTILGNDKARLFIRAYFANKAMPTDPATRRLEFARFFFAEALHENSPDFHLELFRFYASGSNFGVAAPRGHAKTTISSVEAIYRIVHQLNHFTLIISDTYSQARDIVDNMRSELESNKLLQWIYGDLRTDWHWTSGGFTTSNEVRVVARGANMKVRGLKYRHWRPDFVVVDDLENDEAVANPDRRAKLLKWFRMALMPALARKSSQIALIGTILHDDSLLNNLIKGLEGFKGWQRKLYSALNIAADGTEYSLWPAMFSVEKLKQMRDDPDYEFYLGALVFAQEMQNEAIDDGARIFKREWIYGTDTKPYPYSLTAYVEAFRATQEASGTAVDNWLQLWIKTTFKVVYMAVDPAISEETTADYFAIAVIGVDKSGHIWQLDIVNERISDIEVQVDKILDLYEQWRPDKIKVEAVSYQAGLAKLVQKKSAERHLNAPIFKVQPDKDKFRRAVIHSANFSGGLVHVRSDHPLFEAFVKQLLDFPLGKHDDMLDAYMHATEDLIQKRQTKVHTTKPKGF